MNSSWRNSLGEDTFYNKYASSPYETWGDKANAVVNSVCGGS